MIVPALSALFSRSAGKFCSDLTPFFRACRSVESRYMCEEGEH